MKRLCLETAYQLSSIMPLRAGLTKGISKGLQLLVQEAEVSGPSLPTAP
jgi:hypothetical protein